MRDGERQRVPAAGLVPGDVIFIEEGDTIPADARLIHSTALQTAEAALTGESMPSSKDLDPVDAGAGLGDRTNMVFSGTAATYGRGQAVVTATGMQTEMGIVMIGTIVMVEKVRGVSALFEVLILGVALAVAAVPEGLPAVVTAVLALGVRRMAQRRAIVRHLAAVETLGSATVIASDKTGTLTKNEMTVRAVVTASGRVQFGGTGYEPTGWRIQGDPTEGALVVAARKAGLKSDVLAARLDRVGEVPFSSERKLMSTVHSDASDENHLLVFTKGAPDVLLELLVGVSLLPCVGGQFT